MSGTTLVKGKAEHRHPHLLVLPLPTYNGGSGGVYRKPTNRLKITRILKVIKIVNTERTTKLKPYPFATTIVNN